MSLVLIALVLVGFPLVFTAISNIRNNGERIAVKAYTLPEQPATKEKTVARKETFGVTIDPVKFVRIMLNDPQTREMVYNAVRQGPMNHTEILGAANLADDEGQQEWYTVFAGTSRQVAAGEEGFVLRNRRGDRVSLRLKRQEAKTHEAVSNPQVAPVTDAGNDLLRKALYEGDAAAAAALLQMSGETQPLENLFPQEDTEVDVPAEDGGGSPFDDVTV